MTLRKTMMMACATVFALFSKAQTTTDGDLQGTSSSQPQRSRQTVLLAAKNLTITTTNGTVYYYLVSNDDFPTLHLNGSSFRVQNDEFEKKSVKNMRFASLHRFILDEDSTTYYKTQVVDHGLVALRRSLQLGKWNSLVLPFDLTGAQVIDAFGEGTELVTPRGIREGDNTVVELSSVEIVADEVVMKANNHYLIRPTREPDVAEGRTLNNFVTGIKMQGPVYLIPSVSVKKNSTPRAQSIKTDDETTQVRFRGSYTKLDNSVLNAAGRPTNKKIAPGTYSLNDEGYMVQNEDSTTVLAFSSWIENLSSDPQELKFYLDGVNEDITGIADLHNFSGRSNISPDDPAVYDLSGRRVAADAAEFSRNRASMKAGVYIINGRKYIIK